MLPTAMTDACGGLTPLAHMSRAPSLPESPASMLGLSKQIDCTSSRRDLTSD
jgi:hypothetical protein